MSGKRRFLIGKRRACHVASHALSCHGPGPFLLTASFPSLRAPLPPSCPFSLLALQERGRVAMDHNFCHCMKQRNKTEPCLHKIGRFLQELPLVQAYIRLSVLPFIAALAPTGDAAAFGWPGPWLDTSGEALELARGRVATPASTIAFDLEILPTRSSF